MWAESSLTGSLCCSKVFVWSRLGWLEPDYPPIDQSPFNSIFKHLKSTNLCARWRPLVAADCTCTGVNVSFASVHVAA